MTYIFSQGTLASADEVNDNFNKLNKLTNEKAINDVSATNSGVLAGSSQVLIDKFLDANGQNNTVNTGSSTGTYNSSNKYYECAVGLSTIVLEPSFETVTNWTYSATKSSYTGAQDTNYVSDGTYSYKLSALGAHPDYNNYCQILQSVDFTNIKRIRFYIHTESIGPNKFKSFVSVIVGATTIYSNSGYNEELSYTGWIDVDVSAISGNQDLIFRCGCNATANTNQNTYFWIDGIRTYPVLDSIIQSTVVTIPSGKTKVFVTPLLYEALATGDSITADVSIDNGAHYTTGVPINTWTPITSANGTQLIVKANLLTNDGTTSPKILGWRVLME